MLPMMTKYASMGTKPPSCLHLLSGWGLQQCATSLRQACEILTRFFNMSNMSFLLGEKQAGENLSVHTARHWLHFQPLSHSQQD